MKKVLSILLLFCFSLIFSQSYKDVERISSYINQPFSKLEKEQNIKSTDRESKFGLNSKLYTYQDYVVLISETEENSLIGDIVFLPKRDVNSSERWYNICKQVESDSGIYSKVLLWQMKIKMYVKNN